MPFKVTGFAESNFAAIAWCAAMGTLEARTTRVIANQPIAPDLIHSPPGAQSYNTLTAWAFFAFSFCGSVYTPEDMRKLVIATAILGMSVCAFAQLGRRVGQLGGGGRFGDDAGQTGGRCLVPGYSGSGE